jgi:CHAT domain-containing protein
MERMFAGFGNAQEDAHLGFAGRYRGDSAAEAAMLTGTEKEHARARALEAFAALPAWLGKTFVQPWLQDKELAQLAPTSLLLVPHGPLHLLPLHAALLDDGTPLIDRYSLVYLANATMARPLAKRRKTRAKPRQRLVMGPPGPDLQGAQIEAKELADLWKVSNAGQPYMLDRMRVDVLRAQARRLRLVHLATHSTFDFIDYLQSSILFHNERLTLVNLISDTALDFHGTRLLYLSSCASGLSSLDQADELQGLVWAFLYAGTEAVMASLWPVDDGAAQYMASAFYDHWQPGTAPMAAYQTALQQLRSEPEYANPYYWAPFVLFGDGFSPLEGR